jgi:hypothetical protein
MTPDEDQMLRALGAALEVVPEWVSLVTSPTGWQEPLPGSALAYDDHRANPYQVSHAVWAAMLAAVDHLACLRDSVFDWADASPIKATIHTHAQASLVRGALENASRVVWMLEPSDSDERLLRRLRLEWAESQAQATVRKLNKEQTKSESDRLKKLTDLLPPATSDLDEIKLKQKTIKDKPNYTEIVQVAGQYVPSGGDKQLGVWKLCSALAHGDLRGTLGYSTVEILGQHSPEIALAKVTGSVPLLAGGSLMAIDTFKAARKLYGQRTI